MTKVTQAVIRTFPVLRGWDETTESLSAKLNEGYRVVHVTPIIGYKGETDHIEYIVERTIRE